MDGGGKKVEKRSRVERRSQASPYARSTVAPPSTSRFGSILSGILSPFRSNKKAARSVGLEDGAREQESMQHEAELDAAPPSPTPLNRQLYPNISLLSPAPPLEPSSTNNPTLQSTPSQSRTPQRNRDSYLPFGSSGEVEPSPPRVANDVLAEFFKMQGDRPLSELEQAGVMQLLQQAAVKSELNNLPTVFTPNFKRQSQSNPLNTPLPSFFSPGPSSIPLSTPRFATSTSTSSTESPYRRRRPIYVGAGQSARRQRTTSNLLSGSGAGGFASVSASTNDLVGLTRGDTEMGGIGMGMGGVGMGMRMGRSSSEGMLVNLANGAEGKRRKLGEGTELRRTNERETVAVLERSSEGDVEMREHARGSGVVDGAEKEKGRATAVVGVGGVARPSPLWQSPKASTPSPSPPKKIVTPSTPKVATGTAGLVLNVIQQIDAVTPKISRQAVLNPYESSDNPISRIPRSRPARPNTPRASPAPRRPVVAPTPAKEVEISSLEKLERSMPVAYQREFKASTTPSAIPRPSVVPPPFIFGAPTQPPSFPTSSSSLPPTTTKKLPVPQPTILKKPSAKLPSSKLKQVEVIELSSSDEEEEEEEEEVVVPVRKGRMRVQEVEKVIEDEEMDELDDEDEEEDEEEDLPPIIIPARRPIANLPSSSKIPSPTKSRIPQRSSSATTPSTTTAFNGPITASGFSFSAPSVFSPPKDDEEEVVEEKVAPRSHIRLPKNMPTTSAFPTPSITTSKTFSASAPKIGMTITPTTQSTLPPPSFSFTPPSIPIATAPQSIDEATELAAKESAKAVDVARLPKFSFDSRGESGRKGEVVEGVEKGVMDLVREMSRKELPVIRL